jgi:hypothetical protein
MLNQRKDMISFPNLSLSATDSFTHSSVFSLFKIRCSTFDVGRLNSWQQEKQLTVRVSSLIKLAVAYYIKSNSCMSALPSAGLTSGSLRRVLPFSLPRMFQKMKHQAGTCRLSSGKCSCNALIFLNFLNRTDLGTLCA